MEGDVFYADCPHCERFEFRDEDDYFYHASMCEYDQQQADLEGEEE